LKGEKEEKKDTVALIRNSMERFWKRYPVSGLPYAGCARCVARGSVSMCGARQALRPDPLLPGIFVRLFNALRLGLDENISASYRDFAMACDRAWPRGLKSGPPPRYCVLVGLADAEIQRRSEFAAWDYARTEQAIELANSVFDVLAGADPEAGSAPSEALLAAALKGASKTLDDFGKLMAELHEASHGPFPGCDSCDSRCKFRFDVDRPERPEVQARGQENFASTFRKTSNSADGLKKLVDFTWEVSEAAFPPENGLLQSGASLCFAVQQFANLDLPAARQREWVKEYKEVLASSNGGRA
jgi:hypothetical protein